MAPISFFSQLVGGFRANSAVVVDI